MEQCERNRKRNTGAKSGADMRRKGGDGAKGFGEDAGCA
jgi:hypothetical protein